MECAQCHAENSENRKFCRECGSKLSLKCPKCSFENLPGDKFCGECGKPLSVISCPDPKDLSLNEKISRIQKYLPEGLREKIFSQRDRIEGEKKQVTVMFCDMQGFTPLSEKIGPEGMYVLMDQVYEILIHKVNEFGGTVNELTGDGIMALFGAPIAIEDAPQRAIRSAIAIHKEISRFSDRMSAEKELPEILMRIGIHTGAVVVATLGSDLRMEFKAVGETVNMAARMESLAEPGSTYVTKDVFKLTEGLFRFESLGKRKIKGKTAPVNVYQVLSHSSRKTRFDVSAERGLTPLVARDRELEILSETYRRAKGGSGQAVCIVSEPGMGKSRLLYGFRKSITNEDVTFLEGKCLSFSKNIPYHPIIDILKGSFQISESASVREIREKVEIGLKMLDIEIKTSTPYLWELLSLKDSSIDDIVISPQAKKERIIDTLGRIVIKGSRYRPLIIAVEDMHWIDETSEYVIEDILEKIPAESVLLVLTYRPQFSPRWKTKSYLNQILLSPLSDQECQKMTKHFLQSKPIERALGELIVEKSEGVPFFVEEYVRSLKDLGIMEFADGTYRLKSKNSGIFMPSTIQDVIMTRVDALPEAAKELLRIGSAIEREFSYQLIKGTVEIAEHELVSALTILKEAELIYQRGVVPDSTYIFRHALTMEVLYNSILSDKKIVLHQKIGETIEDLYKDTIEEHSQILARHFTESKQYPKAAKYSEKAARMAQRSGAYNDAIEYSKMNITALEQLPQSVAVEKKIIDARAIMAGYYMYLCRCIDAKLAVDPILDKAKALNYTKRLPGIFAALGSYSWAMENFKDASKYFSQAIAEAKKISDYFSIWNVNFWLGTILFQINKFEDSLNCFEESLKLSKLAGNLPGISTIKATMSNFTLSHTGLIKEAYNLSKEALDLSEICGDTHTKSTAYTAHGSVCFFKGDFEKAQEILLQAINCCQKSGFKDWQIWAEIWLANTYYNINEFEKAEKYYKEAKSTRIETGQHASWDIQLDLLITRAMLKQKMPSYDNISELFPLSEYCKKNNYPVFEGFLYAIAADILIISDSDRLDEAEALINDAINADEKNGTRWSLARDFHIFAKLYLRKKDKFNAIEKLTKGIEIMEECGADGWVKRWEDLLLEYQNA